MNHMRHSRLSAGVVAALAAMLALSGGTAVAQTQPDIRVTLLGTGTPVPIINRFGPSILLKAGPEKLLFDLWRAARSVCSRRACGSAT